MAKLIEPHGGKGLTICLLEGAELEAEKTKAAGLKKITISPRVKGDLIMLGNGGFSPLTSATLISHVRLIQAGRFVFSGPP